MSVRSRFMGLLAVVGLGAIGFFVFLSKSPADSTTPRSDIRLDAAQGGSRRSMGETVAARTALPPKAGSYRQAVSLATLSGRVATAEGDPAVRALVLVEQPSPSPGARPIVAKSLLTDAEGVFRVEVPAGAYTAVASLDGLVSDRSRTLALAPGRVHDDLVLTLEPGASLVLTVRAQEDGHALTDCRADAVGHQLVAACDHAGRIRLGPLSPGPLSVRVSSPGYAPKETLVVLARRARLTAELFLTKGAYVSGRVIDPDGRPVAGAQVRSSHYEVSGVAPAALSVVTDPAGAFVMDGVAPGRVTLLATSDGWAEASSAELRLVGGDRREGLELVLSTGGAVAGRVSEAGGSGVEDARVDALHLVDGVVAATDVSTGGGFFRLDGLRPGDYTLSASAGASRALAQGVTVKARDELEVELVLGGGTLTGRVVDAAGTPIAGAWVSSVSQASSGLAEVSGVSDKTGGFRFEGLAGPPFRVKAQAEGRGVAEVRGLDTGAHVELVLSGTGRVDGFVGSDGGRGLEAFNVVVTPKAPSPEGGVAGRFRVLDLLSPDGSFTVDELPAGRYEVRAKAVDHLETSAEVEVSAGRTARVDLRLQPGATAQGQVWRGDEPAGGCLVMGRAPTAADGSFRVAGLPPRQTFLWARCGDESAGGVRVDLSSGLATNVEIRLRPMPERFQGDDFGGIGASLRAMKDGRIVVMDVFEGAPAFYAGIGRGDEVLAVDGWAATGHSVSAVVERIRGPIGQPVVLDVRRSGVDAVFRAVAERSRIATH